MIVPRSFVAGRAGGRPGAVTVAEKRGNQLLLGRNGKARRSLQQRRFLSNKMKVLPGTQSSIAAGGQRDGCVSSLWNPCAVEGIRREC